MKKILLTLVLTAICVCLLFYMAILVAPTVIGATIFGRAVENIAETLSLPRWAIFLMLLPAFLSLWRIALSKKGRKLLAAAIVIAALVIGFAQYGHTLLSSVHNLFSYVQAFRPVTQVNPGTESWFSRRGEPRLVYAHPATNLWRFFRTGVRHDPQTGLELLPVTPAIRRQWQVEQENERESAKMKETAEQGIQANLERLRNENEERMRREKALISALIQTLQSRQSALAAIEAEVIGNSPAQSVREANRQLDDARNTLTAVAATSSPANGSPLDLAALQNLVQTAIQTVDKAEEEINTLRADREKEKLSAEVKAVQQRRETSTATPIPISAALNGARTQSASITLQFRNGTQWRIFARFTSPQNMRTWPSPGDVYVIEVGESVSITLNGVPGDKVFLRAWCPENLRLHWHGCDCDENGKMKPIAIFGESDPPARTLTARPLNPDFK